MAPRIKVSSRGRLLGLIKDRYFLRNLNLETLTRNALAKLWWYAHITIDSKRENNYELLEILLRRQDLAVGITERSIGINKKLRVAILEYLKENPAIAANENQSRELIKGLNLSGGVKMLPLLEINEIKIILEKIRLSFAA